jgi:serine/threonine protein kinase
MGFRYSSPVFLERADVNSEKDVPGGFASLYLDYTPVYQVIVGGMSEVWACLDRRSGQLVAVKRLLPHAMKEWRMGRANRYEAFALRSVNHPNILEFLEKRYDSGSLCLITEFIPGINLAHFLNTWQLPVSGWFDLSLQLLDGLEALHHAGVTHGDIKPDNIMLMQSEDGHLQVKLLDFGMALPLGLQWERGELSGEAPPDVMATAEYVAPELLMGAPSSPASDLYAFGHTIYHCLAGRAAFDYSNLQEILNAQVNETAAPISQIRPEVPQPLSQWVAWHLEKDRDLRPASASDSRAALFEICASYQSEEASDPTDSTV